MAVARSQFIKFVHILYPEHKVSENLGLGRGWCQRVGLGVPSLAYYVEPVHFGFKHPEQSQSWLVAGFVVSVLYYSQNAKYRVLGVHALDCSYEYKPLFLQLI